MTTAAVCLQQEFAYRYKAWQECLLTVWRDREDQELYKVLEKANEGFFACNTEAKVDTCIIRYPSFPLVCVNICGTKRFFSFPGVQSINTMATHHVMQTGIIRNLGFVDFWYYTRTLVGSVLAPVGALTQD